MKRVAFLFITLSTLLFTSCEKESVRGSGNIVDEFRSVPTFSKVSSAGSTPVTIMYGSTFSVKVRGYANLLASFESSVQNGELKLGYRNGVSVRNDNVTVEIVMPILAGVRISGSSDINVRGAFDPVQEFTSGISGSGKIYIENMQTQDFSADVSGSGQIFAFGMHSLNADVNISGSGIIELSVEDDLSAIISGSGTVYYRGNPSVNSTINGNGRVIRQ